MRLGTRSLRVEAEDGIQLLRLSHICAGQPSHFMHENRTLSAHHIPKDSFEQEVRCVPRRTTFYQLTDWHAQMCNMGDGETCSCHRRDVCWRMQTKYQHAHASPAVMLWRPTSLIHALCGQRLHSVLTFSLPFSLECVAATDHCNIARG